jgi:hypothetical protein
MVVDRILDLLLAEAPVSQQGYALDAKKLLHSLVYSTHCQGYDNYQRSVQCLKLCFHLLQDPSTEGDQDQFTNVAAAIHLSHMYSRMVEEYKVWTFLYLGQRASKRSYWSGPPNWHTQAQFDRLVDYLVKAGQGTDYTAIGDAFAALAGLRGSPSTLERKHLYIQTITRFMESEVPLRTRHAAMSAAYALRTQVAAMDRDDEPLRYLFSRALSSVVRARDPAMQPRASTSVDDNLFEEMLAVNWYRDWCYLGLVCALSKEPTWHGHLHRHSHFKNCLAIADSLSSRLPTLVHSRFFTVHLTHIFAIVDDLDGDHEFLTRAIRMYRIWPLILNAWLDMFAEPFFYDTTAENWNDLSSWGIVESLSHVAAYAKKYWERWDNREETHQLIQLVEQVCDKLDEEKLRNEQSISQVELGQENDTFGHRGIPSLSREIRGLVRALQGDVLR